MGLLNKVKGFFGMKKGVEIIDPAKPGEMNDGVWKVLDTRDSGYAINVTIKNVDTNEVRTVKNNWAGGRADRFEYVTSLIGKDIQYSTWRRSSFGKEWFQNMYEV